MKRAAKVDDNHQQIVRNLRETGCLVKSLAAVGRGCPDLLVQFRDTLYLLEIKDGSKSPSRRRLTDDQVSFIAAGWRVSVVHNTDEALAAVGAIKRGKV